jgi:hypothetical protein
MAKASGAFDRTGTKAAVGSLPMPSITRERWFATLRFEAVVKPAGPAALRIRLKDQGYDVTLEQVKQALDVIDPDAVVRSAHSPPPEGDSIRISGRLPESQIDTPWPHCEAKAAATRANTDRWRTMLPIEQYDPPPQHKRLKLEMIDGATLPRIRQQQTPVSMVPQLMAFAKGLKAQGRVVNSTSPVASPVLIIPKPRKLPTDPPRFRFVVDYRMINAIIAPHGFRVNTCESLWYTLDNAVYLSTADAADGYWLAPLDRTSTARSGSWLTAFDTPEGRHEFTCLPQGIQPASGWFQSFMEDVLSRHNMLYTGENNRRCNPDTGEWENYVIVYQDDLIWYSATEADHDLMTARFLDVFTEEKLYLNPNKLNLYCKHTRYLGCIVGNHSLSMDPRKVDAVMDMATPVDASGVRQLVGMCQFYRRWITDFSGTTAPLTDMLKKDVVWARDWGDVQDAAVMKLKTAMSSFPILHQHYPDRPNIICCDASTVQW